MSIWRVVITCSCLALLALTGTAAGATRPPAFRPAGISVADSAVEAATAAAEQRPALVDGTPASQLDPAGAERGLNGVTFVHFDQSVAGIPVLGGGATVAVDAKRRVVAATSSVAAATPPAIGPVVSSADARQLAIAAVGDAGVGPLVVDDPSLVIYDGRLIGQPGTQGAVLAWKVGVQRGAALSEDVIVDAATGAIANRISRIEQVTAGVCDAAGTAGSDPCVEADWITDPPSSGIDDVRYAYANANATVAFYAALGRDSIDGNGMDVVSTVRFSPTAGNAMWFRPADGSLPGQMYYGTGLAFGLDVVAHELTHGVTDYTSGLIYSYESGAINEAMSDVMGELTEISTQGSSSADWELGEDVANLLPHPCSVDGDLMLRDMRNPPACDDPDRRGSPLYLTGAADSGGVHTNSGVMNKAAYLIAEGGSFNGATITGIGRGKSARLWYQTELILNPATTFAQLADGLDRACTTLIGSYGFVTADCAQVAAVEDATQLRLEQRSYTVPATCAASQTASDVRVDGFDNGLAGWTAAVTPATRQVWFASGQSAGDGIPTTWPSTSSRNIRGVEPAVAADATLTMDTGVALPANAVLRVVHRYDFEKYDLPEGFDGGMIEYSADGGAWTDISELPVVNGYDGTIATASQSDNVFPNRSAFIGTSEGSVTTQVDLSSLAGHVVRFRFRIGTDTGNGGANTAWGGWFIDEVRVAACADATVAVAATTTPSASTVVRTPPTTGRWTVDPKRDAVRVELPVKTGTTYAIRAVRGSTTRKGTCSKVAGVVVCSVRAPTGTWRVLITSRKGGTTKAVVSRKVKT